MKIIIGLMVVLNLVFADSLITYVGHSEAVANKEVTPKITLHEFAMMYTGKITHWEDGSRVYVVVNQLDNYKQKAVILTILGVSVAKYKEIVEDNEQIHITDKSHILEDLREHKGSLGVVSADKLILCTEQGLVTVEIIE